MSQTLQILSSVDVHNVGTILGALGSDTGWTWLTTIRNFIMPFLLIAIAAISVTFLVRRQMSQFLQFIAISVLVLVLVYSPEIIQNIAVFLAGESGATQQKDPGNAKIGD